MLLLQDLDPNPIKVMELDQNKLIKKTIVNNHEITIMAGSGSESPKKNEIMNLNQILLKIKKKTLRIILKPPFKQDPDLNHPKK